VWTSSALLSGFTTQTNEATIQLIRLLVGVALAFKTAVTICRGGWSRLEPDRYDRFLLARRYGAQRSRWWALVHKPLLIATLVGAISMAGGLHPKLGCLVAAAGLLHELSYDYRFNTLFLLMLDCCLLTAGSLGDGLLPAQRISNANTWAQFLVVLLATDLYLSSAYAKARSSHFRSGRLLAQLIHVSILLRAKLPRWEYSYPRWLGRLCAEPTGAVPLWRAAAVGVIATEALMPFGLWYPSTRPLAWAVGIGMHIAFTAIMPARLLPFSIASVATYLAFAPL
jgi:hypothetical protein